MENITLGQFNNLILFVVTLVGGLATCYAFLQKGVKKMLLEPLEKKMTAIEKKIDKVDKNATMNYLVRCIEDIDRGTLVDRVAKMRFYDQYHHYVDDLNGNTYIKEEIDRLKKEGKI